MRNYMHKQNLLAEATELAENVVPAGRLRHQLDFGGDEGSVVVELDCGNGFRAVHTVDMTDLARLPYCFECAVEGIQVTPSVACTMSYFCDRTTK